MKREHSNNHTIITVDKYLYIKIVLIVYVGYLIEKYLK